MNEKQFELVGEPDGAKTAEGPEPVPITFGAFVLSLVASARLNLGISPGEGLELADVGEPTVDLALAQQTIDILAMIREKTRGNLEPDEQRLIDHALHDLRLRFVEARDEPR